MINVERLFAKRKILRSKKKNLMSLQGVTKSQKAFLLSLFYGLSTCCDGLSEEWICLYMKFVNQYGLQDHCKFLIDCYIQQLIDKNLLHPIDEINNSRLRFDFIGELSKIYKEDELIADRSLLRIECKSEIDVNLIRIFSVEKNFNLGNLIEWTFFCKLNSDGKFDFNKKVTISYKKYIKDKSVNKIKIFSELFDFSEDEELYLLIMYYLINQDFNEYVKYFLYDNDNFTKIITVFFDNNYRAVKKILSDDGKLRSFGLVNNDSFLENDFKECIDLQSIDSLFSDILSEDSLKEVYDLDSFSVKQECSDIAMLFLESAKHSNILFYGASGAGKTEYARSIVKKMNKKAFLFKCKKLVNEKNIPFVMQRLNCLLSIKNNDSVIIVDEAEFVLKTQMSFSFFGFGNSSDNSAKKSVINKMFDFSQNHVIWILNYTNQIDTSTLRRFTYSIKFDKMTKSMLENIAMTKLSRLNLCDDLLTHIVKYCGQYNITGASIDNVVNIVECLLQSKTNSENIIDNVNNVLQANSTLLFGKSKMRDKVKSTYNLGILNTSENAEQIVEMVENAIAYSENNNCGDNGIRMLFYGVSGSGKTEFARYIAEKLNKKIILKRSSDILNCYVGKNEENIKQAFEEAENTDSILLFDEADSFFSDRTEAQNNWERTIVNEFLTQMEEFSGILICTTNLRKIMDPAMERRFHIKTEFKPLSDDGIQILLKNFFSDYTFDKEKTEKLLSFNSVTPGDFGTLKDKIRFMKQEDVNSDLIIEQLCEIQKEKNINISKIGF